MIEFYRCRDCGFSPCACGNENYGEGMRSLPVKIASHQFEGGTYSFTAQGLLLQIVRFRYNDAALKPEREEYTRTELEAWAEFLGVEEVSQLFKLRYLSVDLRERSAVVFYEDTPVVEEVYPGTPEWDASESALEQQRMKGG